MRFPVLFVCVLLILSTHVYPCGGDGHRAMAEAARGILRSDAESQVEKILGNDDLGAIAARVYFAPWKKGEAAAGTTSPALCQAAPGEVGTQVAVTGPSATTEATPATATKDQPLVNTLGMKFVPVPILGGPTEAAEGNTARRLTGEPGGKTVLFSIWDTRVQDYAVFATETKREWPKPSFPQDPTHPAVNVSWEDAQAFCAWLTERERKAGKLGANEEYRLPSDHEWSCAVGLGAREDPAKLPEEKDRKINDAYPWGSGWPPPKGAGNYAGEELQPALAAGKFSYVKSVIAGYNDGFVNTSPVGSFAANRFGLYDMGGDVWQWCEDWFDKEQKHRVLRGASWDFVDRYFLLSSSRNRTVPGLRHNNYGFRCVVSVSAR